MEIILLSKCSLDIEQYVKFKMSVLVSPSKSLISLRLVTFNFDIFVEKYKVEYQIKKRNKKRNKADPFFLIFWIGWKRANKHLFFF